MSLNNYNLKHFGVSGYKFIFNDFANAKAQIYYNKPLDIKCQVKSNGFKYFIIANNI